MSDPFTPQSSKSRRFRGKQAPTIEADATRVQEDVSSTAEHVGESGMADTPPVPETETLSERAAPKKDELPPDSSSQPPPPQKNAAFSGRAAVTGLIFGLIGGVAGAALMQFAMPAKPPAAPQLEAQLKALETRLASTEAAAREAGQKASDAGTVQQGLRQAVQAMGGRVDALSQQAVSANTAGGDATAQLDQRIAALDGAAQAAAATAKNQIDNIQRSLAAANGRFDALEKQVAAAAKPAADPMPAIRYILAMRLDQAVVSGKPFGAALKAATDAGVSGAQLADVAPFATAGAPTAQQLKADFKEPADAMIAYERGQSGESFTDKLSRMGKSVLRVRPQGTPDGTDAASMVVRIEAALDRSAFSDAAALWNSLPESMKQLSAAWGKRINDRANAAAALAKLSASAIAGLEGSAR